MTEAINGKGVELLRELMGDAAVVEEEIKQAFRASRIAPEQQKIDENTPVYNEETALITERIIESARTFLERTRQEIEQCEHNERHKREMRGWYNCVEILLDTIEELSKESIGLHHAEILKVVTGVMSIALKSPEGLVEIEKTITLVLSQVMLKEMVESMKESLKGKGGLDEL
jgi:hypothetical protein